MATAITAFASRARNTALASARRFAIAISYADNHSILWAIIHGILGWLYVIFVALFR